MKVSFEQGEYGLRAVLNAEWTEEIHRCVLIKAVAELELNYAKGWRGKDLSFLRTLPFLKALRVVDLTISSVQPIHTLQNLRSLNVMTYCKTELCFDAFPKLEKCGLEWRPKAGSLFSCKTLKRLFVNRYTGNSAELFAQLTNLNSLSILTAPIGSLSPLSALTKLRFLRLANLRKLTSLRGIEGLINLEELEIHTCRSIGSIEEVSSLVKLRTLDINNDGAIASIKPLKKLPLLERVTFYESTNILDGDLSPLKGLKRLSRIAFKARPHYSCKREELMAAIAHK